MQPPVVSERKLRHGVELFAEAVWLGCGSQDWKTDPGPSVMCWPRVEGEWDGAASRRSGRTVPQRRLLTEARGHPTHRLVPRGGGTV